LALRRTGSRRIRDGRGAVSSLTVALPGFQCLLTRSSLGSMPYRLVIRRGGWNQRARSRFSISPRAWNQSLAVLVHRNAQITTRSTRPIATDAFIGEM